MDARSAHGHRGRRTVFAVLLTGAAFGWAVMMRAAFLTLYIEPTDAAVAQAVAVRPTGAIAAVGFVAVTAVAAMIAGRWWIVVLALPGVLAGGWLLFAPSSHGAAFLYGVAGSAIAIVVVAVVAVRAAVRRAGGRVVPSRPGL